MRKQAAKQLKEETDAAMAVRRKVIEQRVGQPKKLEGLSEGNYINTSVLRRIHNKCKCLTMFLTSSFL